MFGYNGPREIVIERNDLVFFEGWRIDRNALDKKIFPVLGQIIRMTNRNPALIEEVLKKRLKIICPCGGEWILDSVDRDRSLLQYRCKEFNCHRKVTVNISPLRF